MKIENENILEEEVKQDKKVKNKIFTPKIKTLTCFSLACVLMVGGSFAYFSDYAQTTVEGTSGTVRIGVDDNINLLNADGKDILNPGDVRNVNFTVANEGNKSVDTEVLITLLSSVPMSDNSSWNNINTYAAAWQNPALNSGDVYSSEYELYYADDVEYVEGFGHFPREGAKPVSVRAINYAANKIVYNMDGTVLSGNSEFDEREIEWIKPFDNSQYLMEYLEDIDYNYRFSYDDFSSHNSELGVICLGMAAPFMNGEDPSLTVIIPPTAMAYSEEFETKKRAVEYVYLNYLVGDNASSVCVPNTVKGFIYEERGTGAFSVYTAEEVKDTYGIDVSYYDNFGMFYSTGEAISNLEYMSLPEAEKAEYTMCPDVAEYDMVLLFDPNSNNTFQASNVTIKVEVRAKQHRNTEAGWELVDTMLESVIQDSIFTVDYDNMHRVKLTGVKEGVDFASMTEITIPEGVEVIPASFFAGCDGLETVNLPSTLKEISYEAFANCGELQNINLPDGLEAIGDYAFVECTSLISIDVPDSVKYIGSYAFADSSLESVMVPEGITILLEGTFNNCASLESVVLPSTLITMEDYQFTGCSSLKTVALPENLKNVGYGAFEDCISLNNVVLPSSLEFVDYSMFEGCTSLTNVDISGLSVKIGCLPDTMFKDCTALTNIEIPDGMVWIGYGTFQGCTGFTSFVVPEGIGWIDTYAFYGCDNLTEITLPESLLLINNKAFYCESVVNTTIYTNNTIEVNDYNWTGSHRNITVLPIE